MLQSFSHVCIIYLITQHNNIAKTSLNMRGSYTPGSKPKLSLPFLTNRF